MNDREFATLRDGVAAGYLLEFDASPRGNRVAWVKYEGESQLWVVGELMCGESGSHAIARWAASRGLTPAQRIEQKIQLLAWCLDSALRHYHRAA